MINLRDVKWQNVCMPISRAESLEPFEYGAEYSAPVRGTWNIVHIAYLVPESFQIFVCPQACLRGVILTAAELSDDGLNRFATVCVQENNVLNGDMEALLIDGVSDILDKLDKKPRAVFLFSSCVHQFMGTDLKLVFSTLSKKYPMIDFIDSYMNPIMRKKITPDSLMRKQLFSKLPDVKKDSKSVNIIGNLVPVLRESEMIRHLEKNGYIIKDICDYKTYDDFNKMGESAYNISYLPGAVFAAGELESRLGQKNIYMPFSYNFDVIDENYKMLTGILGIENIDTNELKNKVTDRCKALKERIGNTAIAIDYTATPKPLSLARFLISNGFNVTRVYADAFSGEEKENFEWLKSNAKDMEICATLHPAMEKFAHMSEEELDNNVLAIGQKAAFYSKTNHFVNMLEADGLLGYEGIIRLLDMMDDAFMNEKDMRNIVTVKGWGCCA